MMNLIISSLHASGYPAIAPPPANCGCLTSTASTQEDSLLTAEVFLIFFIVVSLDLPGSTDCPHSNWCRCSIPLPTIALPVPSGPPRATTSYVTLETISHEDGLPHRVYLSNPHSRQLSTLPRAHKTQHGSLGSSKAGSRRVRLLSRAGRCGCEGVCQRDGCVYKVGKELQGCC